VLEKRKIKRRIIIDRREKMSKLEDQVKELRKVIFDILNFTNMYVLVLNEKMIIKFANNSLATDLGFKKYNDILGRNWLDFIEDKDIIYKVHESIPFGHNKEFQNKIYGLNGEELSVHWFNSYINTDYNWIFSFGVKKDPPIEMTDSIESIRTHFLNMINEDRIMINSMREVMIKKCGEPNENCLSV